MQFEMYYEMTSWWNVCSNNIPCHSLYYAAVEFHHILYFVFENGRDVSAYSRRRCLLWRAQLACLVTRSKRNTRIYAKRMRLAACVLSCAQWRHGRSWDETKYTHHVLDFISNNISCHFKHHEGVNSRSWHNLEYVRPIQHSRRGFVLQAVKACHLI